MRRAAAGKQLVLAVSGGRDSMALLHAAAQAAPHSIVAVATFDHATGEAATRATQLVAEVAAELGLAVVIGRAASNGGSEAAWRDERRRFLSEVASATGGTVATAHTRDDQIETVLMRVLRDAGARGLAGLYAASAVVRPLLSFSRDEVAEYARGATARWIEDPTNSSMRFFRNRVRHDLLPALARARPDLETKLLDIAARSSRWRGQLDGFAERVSQIGPDAASAVVAVDDLAGYSRADLTSIWPAIAARVGLAMDWRGTERAAAFTNASRTGARIQLSGGWEIARRRARFELRRWK